MNVLAFAVSTLLLLGFALAIAKLYKIQNLPIFILILILIPMAELVFLAQALNYFGWLGSIPAYLATQALLFALALAAGSRWGGSLPLNNFLVTFRKALLELSKDLPLLIWTAFTAAFYLFNLIITFVVPPNNNDALSTHIARVGFWLRHGSLAAWQTDRWYQLIYPPNAQLALYWQALFLRADVLFGSLQWISAIGAGIAVFALSRQLGFDRKAAWYAALTFLAFPVVLFQSSTTQNDLVMAFAILTAVVFALRAVKRRSAAEAALFILASAFAFGVKQTFFFSAPLLILFGIWTFLKTRQSLPIWGWGVFILCAGFIFTMFGVNKYLENFTAYGNVFGPAEVLSIQTNQQAAAELPVKLWVNSLRTMYGAIDPAGLPNPFFGYFHKAKAAAFDLLPIKAALESADYLAPEKVFLIDTVYPANEDTAQYGPVLLVLLMISLFGATKRALKGDLVSAISLVGVLAAYLLLILIRPGWDEFQARYMMPMVALLLPYYGAAIAKAKLPWRVIVLLLSVVTLYTCALYNPAKPVLGKDAANMSIWTSDRVTLMMAQNRSLAGSVRLVENHVPAEASLGVYAAKDYHFQYPFFGRNFTRDVVPIIDLSSLSDEAWLAANDLNYLLLRVRDGNDFTRPPASYFKVDAMEGWRLYQKTP